MALSSACGVLIPYTNEFQQEAATEQDSIKVTKPHLYQMMDDYKTTRDTIRVCAAK